MHKQGKRGKGRGWRVTKERGREKRRKSEERKEGKVRECSWL